MKQRDYDNAHAGLTRRRLLRAVARIDATKHGFALAPRGAREIVVLARPVEERHAAVLAFLADGESWSGSVLALALGASHRTVQRALKELRAAGTVQSYGHGRDRFFCGGRTSGKVRAVRRPSRASKGA